MPLKLQDKIYIGSSESIDHLIVISYAGEPFGLRTQQNFKPYLLILVQVLHLVDQDVLKSLLVFG
jgi:hypothetical protein